MLLILIKRCLLIRLQGEPKEEVVGVVAIHRDLNAQTLTQADLPETLKNIRKSHV
jgi:hypothetical protein